VAQRLVVFGVETCLEKRAGSGGAVSRVLFGPEGPDGHLSWGAVARHLMRPTRGSSGPGRTSPPIWPCSGWGLPCHGCFQPRGGLLPHLFTLAHGINRGWCILCCPFRRFAAPRSYLAACPVELGLSSVHPKADRDRHAPPIPTKGRYLTAVRPVRCVPDSPSNPTGGAVGGCVCRWAR